MLEVVSFLCVVVVAIVYTHTFYVLPILVKTIITLALWFRFVSTLFLIYYNYL
jgi:hypothetical protein